MYGALTVSQLDSSMLMMKAALITNRVLQSSVYQNAQSLAIFLSMPGREVSTRDIVLQALKDGKEVFVPYLHPGDTPKSRVMDMLQLQDEADFSSLTPDAWGIPSIPSDSVDRRRNALGGLGILNKATDGQTGYPKLHLIFMPAVAFDQSGQRLGHGKGFYDRYLETYKMTLESTQPAGRMPYLVGLALQPQILPVGENIPTNDDDWRVDQVTTGDD
ncbi:uncharacterized protein A1O9_09798 [Exophiala aquamarina CBS 119918]|uniref:5-formyltetrahydrofolate cyclo-ligase n=1 Tax=Exophiala aquamarina CBS 119918 TaxID=1182545 RepID=A0A072P3Z7_9EURO|nr:uncharacterized protein A1O9_09798 [Exophiala aquamarina CBS 119918]KEF54003.1 hypothetical protein A1O9_09798 [Exophiala aquamarina CBS 119918]